VLRLANIQRQTRKHRPWQAHNDCQYRVDRFVNYGVFTPLLTKTADLNIVEE
jgi:hypothetical protein